jgi:subtilisin family serine protease
VLGLATVVATGTALGAGAAGWAAPSNEGVIRDTGATAVPNSYIVVFKNSTLSAQSVDSTVKTLSSTFGGKVSHEYHSALRGFSVKDMTEGQAKRLAADPAVAYVQRDAIYKATDTQPSPIWNLDRIDQHSLPLNHSYTYPSTASNVHAYVIDTGIRITHTEFGGRASYGYNSLDGTTNADDCEGHGTHVAGTVGGSNVGVAKGVALVAVKVLDCDGSGDTDTVTAGVDWVASHAVKPAVANMSLASDGVDPTVNAAVQGAIAQGITFSVAAGNGTNNDGVPVSACTTSPASVPDAITVGATDENDRRASFSNYGSCVDLFAPGVDVYSSYNLSDSSYATADGTSMASPHVAGAAALILAAHPTYTPAQVRSVLGQSASTNVVGNPGSGSPNALVYVRNAEPPQIASKPTVLYNPRFQTTEAYARSTDNHLVYAVWNNGWSSWMDLGGDVVGDPTVLYSPRFQTTEVYARTSTNHLAYIYYSSGWSSWTDLGGNLAGNPGVIYNPHFQDTEVYVRTADNHLAYVYYTNGWSGWDDLQGDVASDPSVLYNPHSGDTEAYVRTSANTLSYVYYANGWSGWNNLGGSLAGDPAVLYNPHFGDTEVYTRTAGNTLSYVYYANGWSGWNDLQGDVASDPVPLYNPNVGDTEVYTRTSGNQISYRYYANGWSGWNPLQGDAADSPGILFNPRFGDTEVYTHTTTNHLAYKFYAGGWSGWIDLSL